MAHDFVFVPQTAKQSMRDEAMRAISQFSTYIISRLFGVRTQIWFRFPAH